MPISGHTKIVGIFGYPVRHTLSPAMHNAAFAALGLDYVYLPFEVPPDNLGQALRALPALQIAGVNLTIPHKERALEYLDEISPQAQLIGAVNTVKVEGHKLIGYNTDGEGFLQSLNQDGGIDPKGRRVCLLGAGGAARAVAMALVEAKIRELAILNRTVERAQLLAEQISGYYPEVSVCTDSLDNQEIIARSDIIINTTLVGMKPDDELPIDPKVISPLGFVCDVIYHPAKTKLLAAAEKRGAKTMNGLGMLLYQGTLAFEIWTGRKAPVEVMKKALGFGLQGLCRNSDLYFPLPLGEDKGEGTLS
ncbi:MAG: shikimate dehydrogenase [Candidatus Schekmanbacteria bacterium]|nr:shikimate dehydrogenase [Candidatus Schekmanbacteria bacterium]